MKKSAFILIVLLVLTACAPASPAIQPAEKPQQPATLVPPPTLVPPATPAMEVQPEASMDGAALLESRCSECHSAEKAKQAPRSKSDWDKTVTRMIQKGAKLSDAEKQALVDYLAQTYGK